MNLRSIVVWCMIAMIFALGIYTMHFIKSESYQCMNNPWTYGIKLLEKANDAPVTAVYTVQKINSASVFLSRDGFKVMQLKTSGDYELENFSFTFSDSDLEKNRKT